MLEMQNVGNPGKCKYLISCGLNVCVSPRLRRKQSVQRGECLLNSISLSWGGHVPTN